MCVYVECIIVVMYQLKLIEIGLRSEYRGNIFDITQCSVIYNWCTLYRMYKSDVYAHVINLFVMCNVNYMNLYGRI